MAEPPGERLSFWFSVKVGPEFWGRLRKKSPNESAPERSTLSRVKIDSGTQGGESLRILEPVTTR